MIAPLRRALVLLAAAVLFASPAWALTANALGTCPSYALTDMIGQVCWRCVLPLSLGAMPIANIGHQVDIENPASPVCVCPGWPPRYGLTFGFWEPSILAEVVRTPYCMPSLGGAILSASLTTPRHGRARPTAAGAGGADAAFYQAHHYIFPLFWILGVSTDNPCLMQVPWDIGYLTELDPTWNKPELSSIFNAEAGLFASPIAIAACAADCVAATFHTGIEALFWCAGCQGSLYPQTGWVAHHNGLVDSTLLTTQRLMFKLHKSLISWRYHTAAALCGPVPDVVMDHRAYKTQMLGPIPNTRTVLGKCCQPFGANSVSWRAGKEFPIQGEDALYLLFRKRNCCFTY